MKHRPRVYVAGPYTGDGSLICKQQNVDRALAAAQVLVDRGMAPLVPHLCHFWDMVYPDLNSWETMMDIDLSWVESAEAVYRLPGVSMGADAETDYANLLGIPVFYTLFDVLSWHEYDYIKGVKVA